MSLGSAWSVGLSGLSTASDQMALVSRNVARAGDVTASRKIGEQVTTGTGTVRLAVIGRVSDPVLLDGVLTARANYSGDSVTSSALDRLYSAVMDPELGQSPASLIAKLESDVRLLANDPTNRAAALQVVDAAFAVSGALNSASALISSVRSDADRSIADSVQAFNTALQELEAVNKDIVSSPPQADITDQLDARDAILQTISDYAGIRVVPRGGNDITVYTDGGVVLFETVARSIEFIPSAVLGPGVFGNAVRIDGVDVTGPGAVMPLRSGSIAAQIGIRDSIAPTFQTQIDEIARGLIEVFADPDRSGGVKPDIPGLFTWIGGSVPPSGVVVPGLAARITVHPQIDPAQGGNLNYLRDGGASAPADPDYNANPSGASGYSGRLLELVRGLGEVRSFDSSSGLRPASSLKDLSSQSVGWIDELRQTTADQLESRTVLKDRVSESLLGVKGINLDQEMADLLRFEQSFQASSRLIATVDQMIKAILEVAR